MLSVRVFAAATILVLGIAAGQSAVPAAARCYELIRANDLPGLKTQIDTAGVDVRDDRGATPLMHAAAIGSLDAVRLLLDAGADVNAANALGATALVWAAGDAAKSTLLIERGADVRVRSKLRKTPLLAAAGQPGNAALLRLILDGGADPNVGDASGSTALMSAAATGDEEMVRLLLDRGADVNAANALGYTPLIDAVTADWPGIAALLLARGADPNAAIDHQGTVRHGPVAIGHLSVLMAAAPYGSPALVRTLLDAGAKVNAADVRGMTPLMLAAASEHQDAAVVQTMLEAGADPNAKSLAGATALDWARRFGGVRVAAALTRAGAQGAAQADAVREPQPHAAADAVRVLQRSLPLLQQSSTKYFAESGCVGCHHQMATTFAVDAARRAGIAVDEAAAARQLDEMRNEFRSQREMFLEGGDREVLVRRLFAYSQAAVPPDATTDSAVAAVMSKQTADGSWRRNVPISRAPMQEGVIALTAEALRAIAVYAPPALEARTRAQFARGRAWLLQAHARTTDDQAMRLLGLSSSGATPADLHAAAREVTALQRRDGGWGGNPNLPSDAFSTGEALYALRASGAAGPRDRVYRRAVEFLLRTEDGRGGWHVRSRAVKVMPYFDSDFPFGDDQWISAAGTALADAALAATLGEPGGGRVGRR